MTSRVTHSTSLPFSRLFTKSRTPVGATERKCGSLHGEFLSGEVLWAGAGADVIVVIKVLDWF